jgi:hypothetical protein
MNCLSVNNGNTVFAGSGTDTQTGSIDNTDPDWASIYSVYAGVSTVNFSLTTDGITNAGGLASGVTIPTNTSQIQALTNGLQVTYNYEYDETAIPSGVPEPSALLLGGSALVAAGVLRRKLGR